MCRSGLAGEEIPAARPIRDGSYVPRRQPKPVRSPQYTEVLDRYLNRLVSLKRVKDALALYRREIDRNANDPGLYERFAEFLNQNKMAAEIEQVYTKATQQFQDRSWHHKLARWYLRQKQTAAFEKLTQSVAARFPARNWMRIFSRWSRARISMPSCTGRSIFTRTGDFRTIWCS